VLVIIMQISADVRPDDAQMKKLLSKALIKVREAKQLLLLLLLALVNSWFRGLGAAWVLVDVIVCC
jgi:hypothetical protein